eukprot:GHVR01133350.1.p1 GENE.GHVR01133350.1~~GHVR01133350.1.p1  ORF type:complete len:174 (+),score=60.90 GHVR01133350.1:76-597(+)
MKTSSHRQQTEIQQQQESSHVSIQQSHDTTYPPRAFLSKPQKSAAASFAAAIVTTGLLHPLDLIRTRMQVASSSSGVIPMYDGCRDACRSIWAKEGIRGLYKGLSSTIIASGVSWGIFRYLFDYFRYGMTDHISGTSNGIYTHTHTHTHIHTHTHTHTSTINVTDRKTKSCTR